MAKRLLISGLCWLCGNSFLASGEDGHSEVKMEVDGMLKVGLEEDTQSVESLRTTVGKHFGGALREGIVGRYLVTRWMKMGVQSAQLRNQFLNIVHVPITVCTESIICVARPSRLGAFSGDKASASKTDYQLVWSYFRVKVLTKRLWHSLLSMHQQLQRYDLRSYGSY